MVLVGGGVVLLVGAIGYLGTSPILASALSIVIAFVLALWAALQRFRAWRRPGQAA